MKQKKIIAISAAIFLMFIACDDGGTVPEQKDDLLAGQYNTYLEEFE